MSRDHDPPSSASIPRAPNLSVDASTSASEEPSLDRRRFVGRALAGLAGAGAVAACGGGGGGGAGGGPAVHTAPSVSWRLASSFPRGLDAIFGASEVFAERVAAMTGDRFRIRVYPGGEIVPPFSVMDAVQQGTVHVGQTASYYYLGKSPALVFDTCVPFGLTSRQQTAWLTEGGGLELVNELFSDFGIVSMPAGNTGAQMGGWYRRPVETLADLQGLKMRMPGLGGEVMSRLGATVQVISGGEVFPALERGAIDAAEWVGPYDDHKLGFHRIAQNYYYPGWWEPGPSLSYLFHRASLDELPTEYREVLRSAAAESATVMQARYDDRNPKALREIVQSGVRVLRFSDEIMDAARETAFALYEEQAAADPVYRKIYDHWSAFREDAFRWAAVAEGAYSAYAFTPES